ncbi:MAG: response regulator [Chromatiales bacterium]|nr:response regulator [Chromatiales bacterium]
MDRTIDVLAIDDDRFVQKMIRKALAEGGLSVRTADDGESGLMAAKGEVPDIILLDVEMPGINGYEVCEKLRTTDTTKTVPIVFLSSHSSLRERLQGYEVGADDYLVKPFEAEHLLARIKVLLKYREEREELRTQYEMAQKTALIALSGSSELGHAMHFLERSLGYQSVEETAQGLFETTDRLSLECTLMAAVGDSHCWFASGGAVSPLEKELIEMSDRSARFLDFGQRTLVNFPNASLLVKNMPLDDQERYGRLKDLLPILLSAANTKINVIETQRAMSQLGNDLLQSFGSSRRNLYQLGKLLVNNRANSASLLQRLVHDVSDDLLRMGLEEDQEEFLLNRIDSAVEEVTVKMDAGTELAASFSFILNNLRNIMEKQEAVLHAFSANQAKDSSNQSSALDTDIELF